MYILTRNWKNIENSKIKMNDIRFTSKKRSLKNKEKKLEYKEKYKKRLSNDFNYYNWKKRIYNEWMLW